MATKCLRTRRHQTICAYAVALVAGALLLGCGADAGRSAPHVASPTATATAVTARPTAPRPNTATLIPPPPNSTPRPTGVPVTPGARLQFPTASDIHMDASGKYEADVGGCHWTEQFRGTDAATGQQSITMRTDCLSDEGIFYYPATGKVASFVT